jgi:hypothetical protein
MWGMFVAAQPYKAATSRPLTAAGDSHAAYILN